MGKYFGTDGCRGEANVDLTVEHAYKVGRYLGYYFGKEKQGDDRARIVIGKDTRRSSYMFEYSLVAGLTASGADVFLMHVTPTPSVSYIVRADEFDCGIMISASHNPFYDNGIKIINSHGAKMDAAVEKLIEDYIFHRQNGSGCKSVFLETANKAIKSRGIKLEMELIMPMSNSVIDATPTKITLQYKKDVISSDVADNIGKHKKSYLVRELGLNLSVNENNSIMRIFRDFQLRRIPSNEAFALIKAEINDSKEYNDAEVNVKIGNRRRKIKWNEFESMMGTYDISEKLYNAYSKSKDFVRELYISVDEYYNMITDSEVI